MILKSSKWPKRSLIEVTRVEDGIPRHEFLHQGEAARAFLKREKGPKGPSYPIIGQYVALLTMCNLKLSYF